jgi:hypothetical protein
MWWWSIVKLSSLIENSDVFSQAQHPRDMTSSAKLFKCFAVSILKRMKGWKLWRLFTSFPFIIRDQCIVWFYSVRFYSSMVWRQLSVNIECGSLKFNRMDKWIDIALSDVEEESKFSFGTFSLILIISMVHLGSSEKCTNVIKVWVYQVMAWLKNQGFNVLLESLDILEKC